MTCVSAISDPVPAILEPQVDGGDLLFTRAVAWSHRKRLYNEQLVVRVLGIAHPSSRDEAQGVAEVG